MKLREALDQIENLGDDDVIFAQKPWSLESDAEVGVLDANLRVPADVAARGFAYFLEASLADELLGVFGRHNAIVDERRALLLHYAEHDAYPQWAYDLCEQSRTDW